MGMGSLPYAVHRTILAVDVEKFGDPSRTNVHQVSVREGLYGALHRSFACSGVPWNACHAEDRGDGALILIPPQVPKNLLAAAVPAELVAALAEHNATAVRQARIRLRAVVHAGEVHLDDYGAAGASIIMAFRLLESAALRSALAESAGVLALMVSEWFFAEVIRHDPDSHPSAFRQVRVTVKETETSAWVCLPGAAGPRRGRPPSSGVAWQDTAAAGSGTSLVVGDIPQQPTAPRPRAELLLSWENNLCVLLSQDLPRARGRNERRRAACLLIVAWRTEDNCPHGGWCSAAALGCVCAPLAVVSGRPEGTCCRRG